MIKFYLSTVAIYFIIFIASGLLTRKQFLKVRDRLRKETNDNSKTYGMIRSAFDYLLISFIPVIRLFALIGRQYMIINPDDFIERMKKKYDE